MSVVPVHGPQTWGQPFYAENDDLAVNLLGPLYLEVKAKARSGLESREPAYSWNFGDGTPIVVNGYEVTHRYAAPGEKVIRVDIDTEEGVVTKSITVNLDSNGGGELLQGPLPREEADVAA